MKPKLPVILLMTLISSLAYAEENSTPDYSNGTLSVNSGNGTFTYTTDAAGNVTSSFTGTRGDDKSFNGDVATSGKAAGNVSALHKSYADKDGNKHQAASTNLTIGNAEGTPTTVTYACSGIEGDRITGDKTITVTGGATVTSTLIGGSLYDTGYEYNPTASGLTKIGEIAFNPSSTTATITVNVLNGGKAATVVGGNYVFGSAAAHATVDSNGYGNFVGNEKVCINIEGSGTEVNNVFGAALSSVNNAVEINIKDGARVNGSIYGGSVSYRNTSNAAENTATFVNSTHIKISGDDTYVGASIFGGGQGKLNQKNELYPNTHSDVKGSTIIEVSGGTLNRNIYGGSEGGSIDGNTEIRLTGGSVKGNVYGGGIDGSVDNSLIVIDGATVEQNVYGGGKDNGTVTGNATIQLLSGDVKGTISGDGADESSTVSGDKILIVGSESQAYNGTVGNITGFSEIIVAKGSTISMSQGNAFTANEMTVTLNNTNLTQAAISSDSAELTGALTLNIGFEGAPKSGQYKIISANSAVSGWDKNSVTVNGVAGFDDLQWLGTTLCFVYRGVDIDAMTTANWGVFKASQAFTGTLWAPRSADSRTTLPGGRGYTAWGSVYAHNSRISGNGADYSIYGGAIGVEKQLRSNRSVGAALGYDWGKVSPFSTSAVHQESFHLAAYGRAWHWCRNNSDSVSVDWSAAYGRTSSEHDSLSGDWTQDSLQLDARATYQRRLTHRTTVSAFAGAQYYAQGSDTSGDNKVKAMHNLRFMLGGGISYALTDRTQLFGEAALHQDADRHNPTVTANGARFSCTNPGRSGVSISAGVEHKLNTRCSLQGSYRFSTADDQNEHNINVGAAYQF